MPARRRISAEDGRAAVAAWRSDPEGSPRATTATAVRYSLEEIAERAPGRSVEVRVSPHGVAQCVEGPRHTRGTPPNVIETDPATWLALVVGDLTWAAASSAGRVRASGHRADLAEWLPLLPAAPLPGAGGGTGGGAVGGAGAGAGARGRVDGG